MPEPRVAAAGLDQRGQLLERAPERAARAGRVLQVQRARLALGERLAEDLAGARDRLARVASQRRAGVQHDAGGADRVADPQRVVSDVSDFARISGSSLPQLSR